MSKWFEKMSEGYRRDVLAKIDLLFSVSEELFHHIRAMSTGSGCTISIEFRAKGIERIAEKDYNDCVGPTSRVTEVKDIYAARLCPRHENKPDRQVKDELQQKLMDYFEMFPQYRYKILIRQFHLP